MGFVRKKKKRQFMAFRGCLNSTLEQLIKKNNVPMNCTTRKRKTKERIEREEEREKRTGEEQ